MLQPGRGLRGVVTAACKAGTLNCSAACSWRDCPTSDEVTITIEGAEHAVHPTSTIANGDLEIRHCDDVGADYEGVVILKCNGGVLEVLQYYGGMALGWTPANHCVYKRCDVGAECTAMLSDTAYTVSAPARLESGHSFAVNCSGLHAGYEGKVTATCTLGTLGCSTGCIWNALLPVEVVSLGPGSPQHEPCFMFNYGEAPCGECIAQRLEWGALPQPADGRCLSAEGGGLCVNGYCLAVCDIHPGLCR